ncbi:hypothetical protein [Kaarinaea lacus]
MTPRIVYLLITLLCFSTVLAKPLKMEEVPDPLTPWVDWVSMGHEHKRCPFLYSSFEQFYCAWPDELNLSLDTTGGVFSQRWQVFEQSWLTLPGEAQYWPIDVTLNGKPALVISHQGKPSILVSAGSYTIKGRLQWNTLPKSLALPKSTALLAVMLNGAPIHFPRVESERLWLQIEQAQKQEDRFELQVFRHIEDTIPAQITLYFDIQVAGSAREISLDLPLNEEFIPLRLQSPLPARLDSNQKLVLQIKPGRWPIELTVRHVGPLNKLTLQKPEGVWVDQEIWVFNAHPQYRIVNLSGVTAIDPQQTLLPDAWKQWPAYRVSIGESMTFNEDRRGDPDPGADDLMLDRTLWLSFAGDQYTVQDQIRGVKKTSWRLEMNTPIKLGQVSINGTPQYITRLEDSDRIGVEVRQGNIQLTADSVIAGNINSLPATGWNQNFNNVRTRLNLPPGYKVFSIAGADHVSSTWLSRWTLLDIFLVLLITAAVGKLWSKVLGAITLVTLTLIYHEPNAPVWIWLFVILGFALLRVLPSGRFRQWALMYRNIALISLILITVPFFIQQIRTSLYPQLESYYQPAVPIGVQAPSEGQQVRQAPVKRMQKQMAEPGIAMDEALEQDSGLFAGRSLSSVPTYEKKSKLELIDPNAILQTGPGLPQWQWSSVNFSWSGPVDTQQKVHITYLGPLTNSLLGWVRIALVTILVLGLLNVRINKKTGVVLPSFSSLTSVLLFCLMVTGLFSIPNSAQAEFPSKALLQELQNRLFAPPDCLPNCAETQSMHINITPSKLTLDLIINSNETVVIPLPGNAKHWAPQRVFLNQQRAQGVIRDPAGMLWLSLNKGQHNVRLEGLLPAIDTFQLPLPLKPHYASTSSDGWDITGIHADGSIDAQLQFTRLAQSSQPGAGKTNELNITNLPSFAQITRNIIFGLDWRVETTITRLSPTGAAIVLQVPLLMGESITTEGVRVENNYVLINMSANQTTASWQSLLNMQDTLQLTAPDTNQWTEVWNLDVSPIWHLQYEGIPVIRHQQADRWLPQWRPWPGEQVTLTLSRPQGVEGQTTTIDNSQLSVTPGIRITNVALSIQLRSSQGAQHAIELPEGSTLQDVRIDNAPIPLRLQDRTLMLPVKPGQQQYAISWQEPRGIDTRFSTSQVAIGATNVNHHITLSVPRDRMVLFVGGPAMGPAVLFWGVVIVFLLASIGLAQCKNLIPLRYWQWALLSIGLVPVSVKSALVVIGWFFIVGFRFRLEADTYKWKFNLYQTVLVGFTLITAATLVYAVSKGLLGSPNMQIYGNGSSQYNLNWYQDINRDLLPPAWMITIPMVVYRILMLLWALWLAFSIIRWSKWFWQSFSTHGYWRSVDWKKKGKTSDPAKIPPGDATANKKLLQDKTPDEKSGGESSH